MVRMLYVGEEMREDITEGGGKVEDWVIEVDPSMVSLLSKEEYIELME